MTTIILTYLVGSVLIFVSFAEDSQEGLFKKLMVSLFWIPVIIFFALCSIGASMLQTPETEE